MRKSIALAIALAIATACGKGPGFLEPPPKPSVSLTASPAEITLPGAATLTWGCQNTTSCRGSWSTSPLASFGSASVQIATEGDTVFTLNGTGHDGSTVSAQATVRGNIPLLAGRVIGMAEGIGDARVHFITPGSVTDSADVGPDSRFSFNNRFWRDSLLNVFVVEKNPANNSLFPALTVIRQDAYQREMVVSRLPRVCKPQSGDYAGQEYVMSMGEAYAISRDTIYAPSFFRRIMRPNGWDYLRDTWASYPVPVAVDLARSNLLITPAHIDSLQRDVIGITNRETGRNLFRLANFSEMGYDSSSAGENWRGVLIRANAGGPFNGDARHDGKGNLVRGLVNFSSLWSFSDSLSSRHELVHTLKIGHTNEWVGLMNPASDRGNPASYKLGIRGVCYLDLYLRAGELERQTGARNFLVNAHQGERLERGLVQESVIRLP